MHITNKTIFGKELTFLVIGKNGNYIKSVISKIANNQSLNCIFREIIK